MAVTTTKRTKATLVKKETVELANSFLQDLPEKPKEDLSLKEAVERLKEPLQEALSKGYSYADIAKLLSEQGIRISALTLKNYVPSGRRQGIKGRGRQVKKGSDDSETVTSAKSDSDVTAVPVPAKRGRGRTASAKSTSSSTTSDKPAKTRGGSAPKVTSTRKRNP